MLFYESNFILMFLAFYAIFLFIPQRFRNLLILGMSYLFYSMWDYRFLSLLVISTLVDYFAALTMERTKSSLRRRLALLSSIIVNIGFLATFKYFSFFAENLQALLTRTGVPCSLPVLNLILPAGISFYTFQTLCYTIDVYLGKFRAEKSFIDFAAYVAFFPQLVAGPIERANRLLPQIKRDKRITIEGILTGLRLFIWGLFKKLYIADNLSSIVDYAFGDPSHHGPITLLIAAYAFGVQIYCDFSGYTDMARGLGKMVGVELAINFNLPYFATSLRDFWRRWHITLSNWFRDYVYIPLGGSRRGTVLTCRNLLITFAISGVWHGAGWNFILWGVIHGAWVALENVLDRGRIGTIFRTVPTAVKIIFTFHLVTFTWILFRAPNFEIFQEYIQHMAYGFQGIATDAVNAPSIYAALGTLLDAVSRQDRHHLLLFTFFVTPLLAVQAFQYFSDDQLVDLRWRLVPRAAAYAVILSLLMTFGAANGKQFIYFQF